MRNFILKILGRAFVGFLGIAILGLLSGCGAGDFWQALRANNEGVKAFEGKNLSGAEEHFVKGLSKTPFLSQLHHNLGFTFEAQKKMDEAIRSYKNAESLARSPVDLFAARFNLGAIYGQQKKIDDALFWYQRALEVAPDSVEVKTNIELLMRDQQQQQGKGGGDGENQQKDQDKKDQDQKDQKDKDNKKDDKQDPKDGKDQEKKPNPQGDAKYKPRPFKGELGENEVKKILGEIKQQEQRIRAEYNRKEMKERPRDKDW